MSNNLNYFVRFLRLYVFVGFVLVEENKIIQITLLLITQKNQQKDIIKQNELHINKLKFVKLRGKITKNN